MSVKVTTLRHVTVLQLSGRVTLNEGGLALREAVERAIKSGARGLLLDVSRVSYMDSNGVGELGRAYTFASGRKCSLKLLSPTRQVDDLLRITGLATLFTIFTDEQQALASFHR